MGPLGSAGNSLSSHDLPWGHPQNGSKACQDSHEVRSNRGARLGWQILGEKAIDRARGHQEEDSLAQEQPEHQASCKEDKPLGPAQGSHGLADGSARLTRNPQRLPANKRTQPGKKNRHIRGQPAPTDIDVVPHLMRKDESSKANAKASSVQRPINTHKSKEAEDELQFEKRQEKRLAFRQNNGDGGERPELPGPGVALLRRSYACGKF